MNIKDLEVNSTCSITLVVTGANARETRAKKPYLTLNLSDGVDTIQGNYWDWSGLAIPKNNTILDVKGQVTEWQGTKQLNIQAIKNNTERPLADFLPSSGYNVSDIYKEAYSLAESISDSFLQQLGLHLLEEPSLQSLWLQAPGAVSIHHAYVAGTLVHSVTTAKLAKAMAENIPEANVDLVVFGALFHDIGKLYTYTMNGIVCEHTDEGMLFDHLFMGTQLVDTIAGMDGFIKSTRDEYKLEIIKHILLSHHGKQEYGAVVPPMCIEAHIVHMADDLDSRVEQIRAASSKLGYVKFTDKLWAVGNKRHITPQYVDGLFKPE